MFLCIVYDVLVLRLVKLVVVVKHVFMCSPAGAGRGKDMANITGHRGKDMSTILQEEGKENGRPQRPSAGQRRKKRRRLNDLDSDSTVDEEESEEEFRLSDRYNRQRCSDTLAHYLL